MRSGTQGYVNDALARTRERGHTRLLGGESHAPRPGRVKSVHVALNELAAPAAAADPSSR